MITRISFKNMIDAGVIAVCVDEAHGGAGPGYSNDYHPEGVAAFTKFLKESFTADELKNKFGIDDIDTYNYRLAIKQIAVPVEPNLAFVPEGAYGRTSFTCSMPIRSPRAKRKMRMNEG